MSSYDVKVHDLSNREDRGKGKSYRARWMVAGKRFERSFTTKALADRFRADLLRATRDGKPFDEVTGLPEDLAREQDHTTWYEHARAYVEMKWPHLAAKSRRSTVESLTTVTAVLVTTDRGTPEPATLRRALYRYALDPNTWADEVPEPESEALAWLARHSLPVSRLRDAENVRPALNACARKLDGKPAAATVVRRKRSVFYNAVGYAVERGLLESNPIDRVQWTAPAVAEEVDRRVVANTAQVESILSALHSVHAKGGQFVAFFGCMYYAAMRPAEVTDLRRRDCHLPATCQTCGQILTDFPPANGCHHDRVTYQWGRLMLAETAPHAGAKWTDDGQTRQVRGLKHRGANDVRPIPIPPELVALLRRHIDRYGVAEDGRLFRAARGGYLPESTYGRVWREARAKALTPEQAASPLAGRPYDLRHAAVSLWLNSGVPATEVARRAGHGVAVLLKVYAGCIDGEEEQINAKIEDALKASRSRGHHGGKPA